MRLFVTGGTGFFGKSLLRHWASLPIDMQPESICILTRNPESFSRTHGALIEGLPVELRQGDILDKKNFPKGDYTHIIHAATDSTLGPNIPPLQRYEQIVNGTKNVLEYAASRSIKRILFTSSGGVYGPQPTSIEKIPESYNGIPDPLSPSNCYGVGKRAAEHICALYGDRYCIEVVIARCFAFVGVDLPINVHFAIGNFIRDAIEGRQITIKGDGSPLRSYMHQEDLANWLMTILVRGRSNTAYNVGSDQGISILELAKAVKRIARADVKIVVEKRSEITDWKNRYIPDIDLAKRELGLSLSINLEMAISRTVRELRSRDL